MDIIDRSYILYCKERDDGGDMHSEPSWVKGSMCDRQVIKYREQWNTLPTFVVANSDNELGSSMALDSNMEDVSSTITSYLPLNCDLVLITSLDYLVCSDESKSESESMLNFRSFANLFSIPTNQEDISIDVIQLPSMDKFHKKTFKRRLRCNVNDPNLKMMLVFNEPKARIMQLAMAEVNKAVSKNIVVAGCMVPMNDDECLLYYKRHSRCRMALRSSKRKNPYSGTDKFSNRLIAILFKGKRLKSASILIDSSIKTIKGFNYKLKELKNTVNKFYLPCVKCNKKQNYESCIHVQPKVFAFMIQCSTRANGERWYVDNHRSNIAAINQEQIEFRQTFPGMPLYGSHGVAQIGADINIESERSEHMQASSPPTNEKKIRNYFTGCTIFAVIGL